MEDLIYIIIGLLWLVFTFYTSSKKRKQKQQEKTRPSQTSQESQEQNILEELFGKTEIYKQKADPLHPYSDNELIYESSEFESVDSEDSVTFEDEYENKGISSVETVGNRYYSDADKTSYQELVKRAQSHRIDNIETEDLYNEEPDDNIIKKDFNIRKAVIYQAILERPYS